MTTEAKFDFSDAKAQRHGAARGQVYELVSGEAAEPRRAAARIAWEIENALHRVDWPIGMVLGSENAVASAFAVGRELFREALRIGEQHGALRMQRGRGGGIVVARPSHSGPAMLLHTYFAARNCTEAHWRQAEPVLRPDLIDSMGADLLSTLIRSRSLMDSADDCLGVTDPGEDRAEIVSQAGKLAWRMLSDTAGRRSFQGATRLGSEWDLQLRYGVSRPVLRQALRVLEDLDLLEARRGRAGGIGLKEPAPGAIARHVFPVLASGQVDPGKLSTAIWRLNRLHLQLAIERLTAPSIRRQLQFDERAAALMEEDEPFRWIRLQKLIGQAADNPIIDTLLRCLVSYQFRQDRVAPRLDAGEQAALRRAEAALVDALAERRIDAATRAMEEGERVLDEGWRQAALHPGGQG